MDSINKLGIKIFYITNRNFNLEMDTKENLKKLKILYTDSLDVILSKNEKSNWSSDKTSRRLYVSNFYHVLQWFGDDVNDFIPNYKYLNIKERENAVKTHSDKWGKSWFLIPNPIYGTWTKNIVKKSSLKPSILRSYEPNYFAWIGSSEFDTSHIEFHLSIRFPILFKKSEYQKLFFTYSGTYDFFLGVRKSSPIISRKQNPGLYYELSMPEGFIVKGEKINHKIGYFHESNGQTINTKNEFNNERFSEDHISRGWDYILYENRLKKSWEELFEGDVEGALYTNVRYHLKNGLLQGKIEEDEFWVDNPRDIHVNEFKGLKMILRGTYNPIILNSDKILKKIKFAMVYETGIWEPFDRNSFKFELSLNIFNLPLTAFLFNGYGKELSSYHAKSTYFGLGVEFF